MDYKDYGRAHRVQVVNDYHRNARKDERIAWIIFTLAIVSFALFFLAWIIIIPNY